MYLTTLSTDKEKTNLRISTVKFITVLREACKAWTTFSQMDTGAQCLSSLNMLAIEFVYTARGVRFTSVGSPEISLK